MGIRDTIAKRNLEAAFRGKKRVEYTLASMLLTKEFPAIPVIDGLRGRHRYRIYNLISDTRW